MRAGSDTYLVFLWAILDLVHSSRSKRGGWRSPPYELCDIRNEH